MKNLVVKLSNPPLIAIAFLATLYCMYLFQEAQASLSILAREEVRLIDLHSNETLETLQHFFEQITEEGRAIHYQTTVVVDMVFPFAYGLFFILLLARFLQKGFGATSNWIYLAYFPVLLMGVDFLENIQILNLLKNSHQLTAELVEHTAQLTFLKNILISAVLGLVILTGGWAIIQWQRQMQEPIS